MTTRKKTGGGDKGAKPLLIRLKDLGPGDEVYSGVYATHWLAEQVAVSGMRPKAGANLAVTLRASKQEKTVLLRGEIATELIACCSRCVAEYPLPIAGSFSLALVPHSQHAQADAGGDREVEVAAAQIDTDTYSGDTIDPEPFVREQLLLLLPDYPVCREGCAGLCADCGRDLNREKCVCEKKEKDTPFAALKNLKLN